MITSTSIALGAIALASFASITTALPTAGCTRDGLISAASTYIAAQQSGKLDDLNKLLSTSNLTYQENNKKADIKTGLLSKALKLDHNKTTADTTACASYTELIATAGPYVIGTQLRFTPDGTSITTIDTIHATTGDWAFDAAKTLSYITPEDWSVQAAAARTTRDIMKNAADAYLDMWSNGTATNAVPWGNPCARTEGSAHVTPSCKVGTPSGGGGTPNSMRRYVIDEETGSIDVLCAFGGQMPDSHEFRLESGKLRYVHTITV